jgi:acetoin utilization deacetylase AcuC-like enzyme
MKIAYKKNYSHPLSEHHPFPMDKYSLLPKQLLHEGIVEEVHFFEARAVTVEDILLAHTLEYWQSLRSLSLTEKEIKKIGFPLHSSLIDREMDICGGTLELALYALENNNCGLNIAGGTHHAFADRGEGYCLLNDQAIAAKVLLHREKVQRILFIDLDVHQGNGSAAIMASESRVFTFSMHGQRNYPTQKENSDLDIALPCGTGDDVYLPLLQEKLNYLFTEIQPQIVFYQAGVDVLGEDRFGRLALSIQGCKRRDELVLKKCINSEIPVVVTMGGGYSRKLSKILEAHTNTFRVAAELFL